MSETRIKTARITVRMTPEQKEIIEFSASLKGMTVNALILDVLCSWPVCPDLKGIRLRKP